MMTPATIDVFAEGQTEDRVLQQLYKRGLCTCKLERRSNGGETDLLRKLDLRLREHYELPAAQQRLMRVLVLRDKDQRELVDLCRSVEGYIRRYWPDRRLLALQGHPNVFFLEPEVPGLRLALHIVTHCHEISHSGKTTIDDYVLSLALRPATAESLLAKYRERGWTLTAEGLLAKIRQEIPDLLQRNGVPPFHEAKGYVRFYAALLQESTSPPAFAEWVMKHAQPAVLREVLAPLLAAIEFLTIDSAASASA